MRHTTDLCEGGAYQRYFKKSGEKQNKIEIEIDKTLINV